MARRLTAEIRDIVLQVNRRNRESTCEPAVRNGWNDLLEDILHRAGVYDGFRYLTAADVPLGYAAGIAYGPDGVPARYSDGQVILPDPSRRAYYLHRHLRRE